MSTSTMPSSAAVQVANSGTEMQQEQPQFYTNLAGHLSAEDQSMIQGIMVKAEEEEVKAQQLALQAAAAAVNANTAVPGQINGGAS
jgi:importin-7